MDVTESWNEDKELDWLWSKANMAVLGLMPSPFVHVLSANFE